MKDSSSVPLLLRIDLARNGTVTLLCREKENDPHCHRVLIKDFFKSYGC
jgi:uncharacterized protein (DUF488 family)